MMSHIGTECVPLFTSEDGAVTSSPARDSGMHPAPRSAKCSYINERWGVLSQLGILVGQIWMSAKWACGDGMYPGEGNWDFHVEQLRLVCSWNLPDLLLHAHEWAGQPVWVHYPEGPCRIP